jgi:urease accessory protein UreE
MDTFYVDMLNRYTAGSEELRHSLRNGLEQKVKYHNDTKAESDLGLSFADGPVADPKDELESLDMEAIVIAAEQADLIEKTDREREELQAAQYAAEKKEFAGEEGLSGDGVVTY